MPPLTLPTLAALDAAASSLSVTATPAEARKLIAAQCALHEGLVIVAVPGAFLVRSFTSGVVYKVSHTDGCDCPARNKPCKHEWSIRILEEAAQRHTRQPAKPLNERLAKARREMAELF